MDWDTTLVSPLHEQGQDESEFTITRVAEEVDFGSTVKIEMAEELATTRRRPAPAAFDRDACFDMDQAALERIHNAIEHALAGAPLSSVPSVAVVPMPVVPAPVATAPLASAPQSKLHAIVAVGCAFTALATTAAVVLTLVS